MSQSSVVCELLPKRIKSDCVNSRPEATGGQGCTARKNLIMLGFRLYLLQRLSAMIMAPLVVLHLGVMIVAIRGGLDSTEILSRTQGSLFWGCAYGLFVITVSIHAAIGVKVVLFEWLGIRGLLLNTLSWILFGIFLLMGTRAVYAVVA